jgi:Receptor family ligand binding region
LILIFSAFSSIPVSLGGLFSPLPNDNDHQSTDPQEIAFRYAVDKINADNKILPRSKLYAEIERIMPQDSFHASKRVCHLMKTGVAAIFGPQSSHTASHVQSICDTMEVSWGLKHSRSHLAVPEKSSRIMKKFLRFAASFPFFPYLEKFSCKSRIISSSTSEHFKSFCRIINPMRASNLYFHKYEDFLCK